MTTRALLRPALLTEGLSAFYGLLRAHRFLRFLVVGALNTAVGYSLFLVALAIMPTPFSALVLSTILAILFNFRTIGGFVFGVRDPRLLLRFFGVYAIVFMYNAAGLAALQQTGLRPWLIGLLLLPGGVAISYLLNRGFVFRSAA
jgi:putative flippase GtrA